MRFDSQINEKGRGWAKNDVEFWRVFPPCLSHSPAPSLSPFFLLKPFLSSSTMVVKRLRAAVVVVGDVGRSPRMQYHALSLAKQANCHVDLIGLQGTEKYKNRNRRRLFYDLKRENGARKRVEGFHALSLANQANCHGDLIGLQGHFQCYKKYKNRYF